MLDNIKYTTDGKKVVVIGNLNSQEKIVQEIFVVGGSEIPSGEHFVVKSLHDSPSVSWKESELKKLDERYNKQSIEYKLMLDRQSREFKEKSNELRAKLNYFGLALKNLNENSFNTLVDYITGEIKWVVVNHYEPEILPISEFNQMYEDKLRLISIFGKDDGTFGYAVGDYYDYSGGNKKFLPFKNYDDAFEAFKTVVLSKGISSKTLELSKKYGFEFPSDEVEKFVANQIKIYQTSIDGYTKKILEWNESIIDLTKLSKHE